MEAVSRVYLCVSSQQAASAASSSKVAGRGVRRSLDEQVAAAAAHASSFSAHDPDEDMPETGDLSLDESVTPPGSMRQRSSSASLLETGSQAAKRQRAAAREESSNMIAAAINKLVEHTVAPKPPPSLLVPLHLTPGTAPYDTAEGWLRTCNATDEQRALLTQKYGEPLMPSHLAFAFKDGDMVKDLKLARHQATVWQSMMNAFLNKYGLVVPI